MRSWLRGPGSPLFWPALVLLALYVGWYIGFAAQLSSFPFDIDQGETYDAWSAWLIDRGQLPYSDNVDYPYYSHGYPPLWSYLVSIPMAWIGPHLGVARAVSASLAVLSALVVARAAAARSGSAWVGLLAAAFFLSSPYVYHTTPLARVNAATLLLSLLALWLFERPTRGRVIAGSLMLVAALFTKPTAVDAVVAGLGYVLLVNPRRAVLGMAVLAVVGLSSLAVMEVASGGTYWMNVLAGNTSPFDLEQLRAYVLNVSMLHVLILGLAAIEVIDAVRRRAWSPWVLFLPVTATLAVATIGKTGAGESYFLGTLAAASMLAAVRFAAMVRRAPAIVRYGLAPLALFCQALLLAHGPLSDMVPWLPDRGPQAALLGRAPSAVDMRVGQQLSRLVADARGPVLSEDASFVLVAGKPLVGATPPSLRNLYHAGLWDPAPLVRDVRARRYAIVVLNAALYPEPVLIAIGQSYFEDQSVRMLGSTYHVFLPGTT